MYGVACGFCLRKIKKLIVLVMKKLYICMFCLAAALMVSSCKKDPVRPGGGGSGTVSTVKKMEANGVSFNMVLVKGGTFWMGAQADDPAEKNFDSLANKNEKPVHQVKLSDYYIGETVVTQALWEAVMGSNHANVKGDNLPMVQITYDDCEGFIKKLNQLTGAKFRLPTEAEWEYAARGGGMSRGFMFSGGNNLDDVAWYYYNSDTIPHPVKTKRGNELGLYDMTGNVWEICYDWYGPYGSAMQENPTGPAHGDSVVIRGGSWYSKSAKSLRLTYRYMDIKNNIYSNQGFRLVMEVPLYTEKDSADGLHCVLNGVPFVMKAVIGGYAYLGAQSTDSKAKNYDKNAGTYESPVHNVKISDFYIGETEVTQALWEAVMGDNPSYSKGANLPVERVSAKDIEEKFLPKLNNLSGRTFRLPSEAEWEYAARGGQRGRGTVYAGDTAVDNVAWYRKNSSGTTRPVKGKMPNELGLYDMCGNVAEWCRDNMRNYSTSDNETNPLGDIYSDYRAVRGGNWFDYPEYCRVSTRSNEYKTRQGNAIGFRIVCERGK